MTLRTMAKKAVQPVFCGAAGMRNAVMRRVGASPITVLMYHRVFDDPNDVNAVSPANFEKQISFLKENYRVISAAELLALIDCGKSSERCVLVTFDDGYRDNFTHAMPLLRKYRVPALFFVSSGIVGTSRFFDHDIERLGYGVPPMTWEEVGELARCGFEIGSHTVNHARLSACNRACAIFEIAQSKCGIERRIEREVICFSYPFGQKSDFSATAAELVKKIGYSCNFSGYGGLNLPGADRFDIRRQAVPDSPSLLALRACVEGWRC